VNDAPSVMRLKSRMAVPVQATSATGAPTPACTSSMWTVRKSML
jgi:hypothetical protein